MSEAEDSLAVQMKWAGLPVPVREHVFHKTRKWRFDFAWPLQMLAVEVEGGQWTQGRHTRGGGYEQDMEKYNEAALLGWRVLRVTAKQAQQGTCLGMIERALTGEH